MGQIKWFASMVFIVLFTISLITFLTNFAEDNSAVVDIGTEDSIDSLASNTRSNITLFKAEADTSTKALWESEINPDEETTRTGGQFKGSVGGLWSSVTNVFSLGNKYLFGDETGESGFGIITTTLISFFIVITGLYIWKTWKGNPD